MSEEIINEFDLIIEHLIGSGFPVEEALKLMVNMSEEKRLKILASLEEEDSDRMRDRHQERGGHAARTNYKNPPKPNLAFKGEVKKSDGMSALEKVKADLQAKYGKNSIISGKKKSK